MAHDPVSPSSCRRTPRSQFRRTWNERDEARRRARLARAAARRRSPRVRGPFWPVRSSPRPSRWRPPAATRRPPPPAPPTPPSETVAVNLIRLLVKQGTITQAAADGLLKQAQDEANQAKWPPPAHAGGLPPPAPGVIRVPYVPQVVRDQIRDEVKQDVMAQAKSEGWASPGARPDWINHIQWSGDFRLPRPVQFLFAITTSPHTSTTPPSTPTAPSMSIQPPIQMAYRFSIRAPIGSTRSISARASA